jgi:hypothetical protein
MDLFFVNAIFWNHILECNQMDKQKQENEDQRLLVNLNNLHHTTSHSKLHRATFLPISRVDDKRTAFFVTVDRKCMEIRVGGMTHVFDNFECAIYALTPRRAHCGCQILGDGMESNGAFFRCALCAD